MEFYIIRHLISQIRLKELDYIYKVYNINKKNNLINNFYKKEIFDYNYCV